MAKTIYSGSHHRVECDGDVHRAVVVGRADDLQCECFCNDPRFVSDGFTEPLFREYHDRLRARLGMPPMYVTRELTDDERQLYPDVIRPDGTKLVAFNCNGQVQWRRVQA